MKSLLVFVNTSTKRMNIHLVGRAMVVEVANEIGTKRTLARVSAVLVGGESIKAPSRH